MPQRPNPLSWPNALAAILLALMAGSLVSAQVPQGAAPPATVVAIQAKPAPLSRFDLDFPGGTPRQLIDAIQKTSGKPVNAIIREDHANVKLPALKMRGVDVAELFQTLMQATQEVIPQWGFQREAGFKTINPGRVTDETIWYFQVMENNPPRMSFCRFYLLTPFLEQGLDVSDITTAITTAWKMIDDRPAPKLSYHPETKLLIAVGDQQKIEYIDQALRALTPLKPTSPILAPAAPDTKR